MWERMLDNRYSQQELYEVALSFFSGRGRRGGGKKEEETEEQAKYWQRILGASYNEYVVEQHRAEEIRIASMGKGKRIRKKINYAESRALEEQSVAKVFITVYFNRNNYGCYLPFVLINEKYHQLAFMPDIN